MGAIGGLLGLGGGAAGTGFAAPSSANIQSGVNAGQANQLYGQNQAALQQQQALLQALQGQQGIQNQSNVFNQQQTLANQLAGANAVGNQSGALSGLQGLAAQQQATAGQYQNLANGVGPNPAQAQLAQNTAANVAQTGALMAGQRGAAQNVGLIARQAGQQGAQEQQNATGQAATLQAQQQLAGLQGLSGQQAAIGQTQGNIANIAQQQLAAQQAQQGALAGLASNQTANQIGATAGVTGANQAQYGNVLNALGSLNNANVSNQSNINSANAGLAQQGMQGQQSIVGGVMGGAGTIGKLVGGLFAGGGDVAKMASGGVPYGGQSSFGQFLTSVIAGGSPNVSTPTFQSDPESAKALKKGVTEGINALAPGPKAPQTYNIAGNQGEAGVNLAGMGTTLGAKGGDLTNGGKVGASKPGQKAVSKGDSYSNDKIPAVLSEHEIVLPRSVTMSRDPAGNAAKFVQAILAKKKGTKV